MIYLKDIAKIIYSKNVGPFEVTMNIIFQNEEDYRRMLGNGVINHELVPKLYHTDLEKIITLSDSDAARAIRATLPRPRKQDSTGETDTHTTQQHVPLTLIELPWNCLPISSPPPSESLRYRKDRLVPLSRSIKNGQ